MTNQGIEDDLGAKSTNWLAGWLYGLSTSFPRLSEHGVDLGLVLFSDTSSKVGAFFEHIQLGDVANYQI